MAASADDNTEDTYTVGLTTMTKAPSKKGRKKKAAVPSPAHPTEPTHDLIVIKGTLKYTRDWPRTEARAFLKMLIRDNDLVKVVPSDASASPSGSPPPDGDIEAGEDEDFAAASGSEHDDARDPAEGRRSRNIDRVGEDENDAVARPTGHDRQIADDAEDDDDGEELPDLDQINATRSQRKRPRSPLSDHDDFTDESDSPERRRPPPNVGTSKRPGASKRRRQDELPAWTKRLPGERSASVQSDEDEQRMDASNPGLVASRGSSSRPTARPVASARSSNQANVSDAPPGRSSSQPARASESTDA